MAFMQPNNSFIFIRLDREKEKNPIVMLGLIAAESKKNYTQFSQIRKRNVREYIENYSFKERLSCVFREAGYESRYELFPEDQRGMD